jgi:hypothetical protein
MLLWLQTCNRPYSNISSPSYVSGHFSATLDTGNDIGNCDQDSTGFQGYQQNVSIISTSICSSTLI